MVGQTRSKLRDASPDGPQSSRTGQARRRRSAGTVEPQQERSAPQERTKWSLLQHFLLGGRKLPSGARNYAARRIRNLNAQNYFPLEEVTKILLHDRFQFLHTLLDHFREKVQALQIHRFSHRTLFGVAAFVGILHWLHLITLFENDRHFSHLSSLEREMTFRTEMGLYYSYFKTIIEAPSFLEGLWMIMNDRLTEYPLVINTVKRFHLYPEIASLFPMYVVGYIEPSKFQKIIYINMGSVALCFILMFGNPMYLSSYYSSCLIVSWAILQKKNKIQKLVASELQFWLAQGCAWWCGTIILKFGTSKICGVSDHIRLSDLIAARILRYTDFDTLIYTCAPEFDFMERATPLRYTKTLLLPLVLVITYLIFKMIVRDILCVLYTNTYQRILTRNESLKFKFYQDLRKQLLDNGELFGWLFCRIHFENVVFGILTMMSIQGCANLHNQWSIMGEFTNLPQEELIHWIRHNTRPDAVFAGAMPTMASIKLSTLHPIVNHPHYEDADLRARTKIVYSAYSRKPAVEVRNKLLELHVNYYVLEEAWCVVRTKPGCSMLEIWDVEDPSNAANPPLCSILLKDSRPYFTTVFQNSMYRVLKIN